MAAGPILQTRTGCIETESSNYAIPCNYAAQGGGGFSIRRSSEDIRGGAKMNRRRSVLMLAITIGLSWTADRHAAGFTWFQVGGINVV